MKFACVNLGCKVNRVEIDTITSTLLELGWNQVYDGADVVIVNTCTVTAEADRKTRKEVNRALAKHPHAHVVVTGCAAVIGPEALAALSNRVETVGKDDVVKCCLELAKNEYAPVRHRVRTGEGFRTRVGVKMQDGCDNACTYCIVHIARGRARSMDYGDCMRQVLDLYSAGVHEVVLTGIDLGAYSHEGKTIADFAADVLECAPGLRIRLSSIEPNTVDDKLVALLVQADGMLCRHLHLPAQSGSSKVLADMARRYNRDDYLRTVHMLYENVPALSLSTDMIVGFPGESDQDFADTVSLARECRFARMHVFRYSRREGTPAAARRDQVPSPVKIKRAQQLASVAQELRMQEGARRVGARERVLVESSKKGMTESYFPVRFSHLQSVAPVYGSLIECTLEHFGEDGVFTV